MVPLKGRLIMRVILMGAALIRGKMRAGGIFNWQPAQFYSWRQRYDF